MFQKLYRWTLSLAESQHAPWALGAIAFAESSFFPVPPDAILIPMSLARPKRAWVYALICTVGSVAGAMLGYAIGAFLFETVGKWLINLYGYGARVGQATLGIGRPWRVRRIASIARTDRRRAVSTTDLMSA